MNTFSKLRLILTLKCEQASQLTSESFERRLKVHERMALKGHNWVCWSCRQFNQQLRFMRSAIKQLASDQQQTLEQGPNLSAAMKAKLKTLRLSDK